jgi:hypothetical protein
MVTLLRDQTAVTGQTPFEALAAASHPSPLNTYGTETRRAKS